MQSLRGRGADGAVTTVGMQDSTSQQSWVGKGGDGLQDGRALKEGPDCRRFRSFQSYLEVRLAKSQVYCITTERSAQKPVGRVRYTLL